MSDKATEAMANLELVRELYTEAQRNQFYIDYHQALENQQEADRKWSSHWRTDPVGWKFWKRRPASWEQESLSLSKLWQDATHVMKQLEMNHPLLVKIYWFKYQPLD